MQCRSSRRVDAQVSSALLGQHKELKLNKKNALSSNLSALKGLRIQQQGLSNKSPVVASSAQLTTTNTALFGVHSATQT